MWSCTLQQTVSKKSTPEYHRQYRRGLPGRLTTAAYNARVRYPKAKPVTAFDLLELFLRQGGRCALTGELFTDASQISLDHVLPRRIADETAANDFSNLALVRLKENQRKKERTLFAYFADRLPPLWYCSDQIAGHVWRGRTRDDVLAYYDALHEAKGLPIVEETDVTDDLLAHPDFIARGALVYGQRLIDGELATDHKTLTWRLMA